MYMGVISVSVCVCCVCILELFTLISFTIILTTTTTVTIGIIINSIASIVFPVFFENVYTHLHYKYTQLKREKVALSLFYC